MPEEPFDHLLRELRRGRSTEKGRAVGTSINRPQLDGSAGRRLVKPRNDGVEAHHLEVQVEARQQIGDWLSAAIVSSPKKHGFECAGK